MINTKTGIFYLCIVVIVLAFADGCQQKEPLEPPYENLPVVVVDDRDYVPSLLSCISEANESIHIIMYLMKYYPQDSLNGVSELQRALISAKQKGVDVRIILEKSDYNSDLNATNESTFVYLDSMGIAVRFDPVIVTTHAKLVIVDGRIAFVGSANWSKSAFEENNEMNVRIQESGAVAGMDSYFQELWSVSTAR